MSGNTNRVTLGTRPPLGLSQCKVRQVPGAASAETQMGRNVIVFMCGTSDVFAVCVL